jgi:hypothetical protein
MVVLVESHVAKNDKLLRISEGLVVDLSRIMLGLWRSR